MKIVILADSITTQSSGIHYYGVQFVERLLSNFPSHEYNIIATKKLPNFNCQQTIVPLKRIPFHLRLRQLFTIPRLLKKLNPDHVIELAHFGPFRLNQKIKRSTVIHDLTPINLPEYHSNFSHLMHKFLMPGIIKKADSIIVNSTLTESDVIHFEEKANNKTKIIFPALDIPQRISKAKFAQGKYLLAVGTIEPRKNYKLLLDSFEAVAEFDKELKLIIVGKMGWKMNHFQELIDKHPFNDRIIVTGYVSREELWDYYKNAFLFVFSTNYEGFGIPVLEACYHGLAMVLSEVPTSTEIAGDAADYFEKGNKKDLSQKIIKLLSDEEKRIGLTVQSKERYSEMELISIQQMKDWFKFIS